MQRECWKLTQNKGSFFVSELSSFHLTYSLEQKTIPKIGKIFCFDNPKNLYFFLTSFNPDLSSETREKTFIFKGMAENPYKPKDMPDGSWMTYWRIKKQKKKPFAIPASPKIIPTGTLLASSFTPVTQYTWKEFQNLLEKENIL